MDWEEISNKSPPNPRSRHSMACIGGNVYMFGGRGNKLPGFAQN